MTYPDDEPPTKPDTSPDPGLRMAFRLVDELCDLDKRRLSKLIEAWFVASIEQRILIEEVALEFVRHKKKQT